MTDLKEERARWKADNFAKHYGRTLTGRVSQSQPEIQTLNKRRPRSTTIIAADFTEIEARVLALYSRS